MLPRLPQIICNFKQNHICISHLNDFILRTMNWFKNICMINKRKIEAMWGSKNCPAREGEHSVNSWQLHHSIQRCCAFSRLNASSFTVNNLLTSNMLVTLYVILYTWINKTNRSDYNNPHTCLVDFLVPL